MRWFGLGCSLALVACTSSNPDFEGEVGPIPMRGTDGSSSGASTSPSSGLVTTDSASGTGAESTDGDPSSDSSGESAGTGIASDVPGQELCPEEAKATFEIRLTDVTKGHLTPDCAPFDVVGDVVVGEMGSEIAIAWCDNACPCSEPVAGYTITFGEPGAVPDVYGGCRRVRLWAGELAGVLGCEWAGFSIGPSDDGPPLVVGSNRLVPDALDVNIDFGEGQQCSNRGCSDSLPNPGTYALSVEGVEVWPEDPLTPVMFGEFEYDFDNRMSHVTAACEQQVSWWAELR